MHTRRRAPGSQHVAIVSANPETLDGLQGYLLEQALENEMPAGDQKGSGCG